MDWTLLFGCLLLLAGSILGMAWIATYLTFHDTRAARDEDRCQQCHRRQPWHTLIYANGRYLCRRCRQEAA